MKFHSKNAIPFINALWMTFSFSMQAPYSYLL